MYSCVVSLEFLYVGHAVVGWLAVAGRKIVVYFLWSARRTIAASKEVRVHVKQASLILYTLKKPPA